MNVIKKRSFLPCFILYWREREGRVVIFIISFYIFARLQSRFTRAQRHARVNLMALSRRHASRSPSSLTGSRLLPPPSLPLPSPFSLSPSLFSWLPFSLSLLLSAYHPSPLPSASPPYYPSPQISPPVIIPHSSLPFPLRLLFFSLSSSTSFLSSVLLSLTALSPPPHIIPVSPYHSPPSPPLLIPLPASLQSPPPRIDPPHPPHFPGSWTSSKIKFRNASRRRRCRSEEQICAESLH